MTLADKILAVLKEGLGAWKTYLATREEAYKRSRDKRQRKAIEWAERGFLRIKELEIIDKEINKCSRYFFKYNQ